MSNIRRVTKSTNCVDCYNNNPFQQNEGLKSYAKMISNHTNTESCKSCEPCYDPYLKKVFTEGCLTGEGTECNPLSIDLDCIPSGGSSLNIYNNDGTLTDDRILEGDGKTLGFYNLRSFLVSAIPEEGDNTSIALGNITGTPTALNGISLGGEGLAKGMTLSGIGTDAGVDIQGSGTDIGTLIGGVSSLKGVQIEGTGSQGIYAEGFVNKDIEGGTGIYLKSDIDQDGTATSQVGVLLEGSAKYSGIAQFGASQNGNGVYLDGRSITSTGLRLWGYTSQESSNDASAGGVGIYASNTNLSSTTMPAFSLYGLNRGAGDDIRILPGSGTNQGKISILNLPTDNTATQVLAKDSDGRLCWRDVSSL